jgi:alkyl hydroperoxide reductase subunit AhpF
VVKGSGGLPATRRQGEGMGIIREEDAVEIRQFLQKMQQPVKLVHFTQELNLQYGREARQLLQEVAALSDHLTVEVHDFLLEKEKAAMYGVDKVPATIVCDGKDHGIRFYGIPAGYEFSNLLDAIVSVSRGDSGLDAESRQKLAALTQPVHLEVFVTPT